MDKTTRHENGKGQEMQTSQGLKQSFTVASEAAKASHPAKAPLDHPPSRQKDKALLGFWQLDDFEADAVLLGCLVACVSLIHKGHFCSLSLTSLG